jgi:hypothetical protein
MAISPNCHPPGGRRQSPRGKLSRGNRPRGGGGVLGAIFGGKMVLGEMGINRVNMKPIKKSWCIANYGRIYSRGKMACIPNSWPNWTSQSSAMLIFGEREIRIHFTLLSSAYLLCLRTVGSVGWHHLSRCSSWGLHALMGSLVVHGPFSSVLCCKSIGRCHLFGTCGIGDAASCCARFGVWRW